ncbi:MAG TPA: hypothetical protein VNK94_00525 [Gaiellaceae bacterium]|nr:hypothetical protein [Gaiellaceae bacterium]
MDEDLQETLAYGTVIAGAAETLVLDTPGLDVASAITRAAMRFALGAGANFLYIESGAAAALCASEMARGRTSQALAYARSLCDRAADVKSSDAEVIRLRAAVTRTLVLLARECRGRRRSSIRSRTG